MVPWMYFNRCCWSLALFQHTKRDRRWQIGKNVFLVELVSFLKTWVLTSWTESILRWCMTCWTAYFSHIWTDHEMFPGSEAANIFRYHIFPVKSPVTWWNKLCFVMWWYYCLLSYNKLLQNKKSDLKKGFNWRSEIVSNKYIFRKW